MDPVEDEEVESRKIDFKFKKKGMKRLLLFDLDETLAHCMRQEKPERPPDVRLDIKLQSGKVIQAGFNIRPFTYKLLEAVNKYYEVGVFTASHHWYADVILDYMDPKGIYF